MASPRSVPDINIGSDAGDSPLAEVDAARGGMC
jgi:hypothetical protein